MGCLPPLFRIGIRFSLAPSGESYSNYRASHWPSALPIIHNRMARPRHSTSVLKPTCVAIQLLSLRNGVLGFLWLNDGITPTIILLRASHPLKLFMGIPLLLCYPMSQGLRPIWPLIHNSRIATLLSIYLRSIFNKQNRMKLQAYKGRMERVFQIGD